MKLKEKEKVGKSKPKTEEVTDDADLTSTSSKPETEKASGFKRVSIEEDEDDESDKEEEKAAKASDDSRTASHTEPTPGVHSKVFMDVVVGNDKGRIVIHLDSKTPKTSENFRALCTGEKGIG